MHTSRIRRPSFLSLLAALALFVASACATSAEVQRIVEESNALLEGQLLLTESSLAAEPSPDGKSASGEDAAAQRAAAIRKIDDFIARHPDQPAIKNALVIRKSMLLLTGDQPNMARAAFEEFDSKVEGNTRDLILYESREGLLWWWGVAPQSDPTKLPSDTVFKTRIEDLGKVFANQPKSAIRYYLVTMRAQIQLKRSGNADDPLAVLREGLDQYAREFDTEARGEIADLAASGAEAEVPTEYIRFYVLAPILYGEYASAFRRAAGVGATEAPEGGFGWSDECGWLEALGGG